MKWARAHTSCSALRKKSSGRSGASTSGMCDLSVKVVNDRLSLASRFLATKLLLAPRLRCSCQGLGTVTRQKSNLHQLRCNATTANPVDIQALLLDAAEISQRDSSQFRGFITRVTSVTNPGTHRLAGNGYPDARNRTQPGAQTVIVPGLIR